MVCPVTNEAASEHSHTTASTISSDVPTCPMGSLATMRALRLGSFKPLAVIGVWITAQRAWLLPAARPAWERLRAAGRGLRPVTQPQAGPAQQPTCSRRAAGRAHGQPPGAG